MSAGGDTRVESAERSPLSRALLIVPVAFAAAVGIALMGFGMRPSAPAEAVAPVREPIRPQRTAAGVVDDAEKTKADDLTESLRKLERAEAERRELERTLARKAADERAAIESARKREEQARDKKRHESVKRDLENLALASARRKVAITMYSTTWCGVCTKARDYMKAHDIAFSEVDVDRDAAAWSRARALNPRGSVPTIAIDAEVLVGFSPDSLEARITRAARARTGS